MSQSVASATARRAPAPRRGAVPQRGPARPPTPTLRVVAPPAVDRGRTAFVVLCLGLLVGGLLAVLLLNTAMAQGSFALHDLQRTSGELGDEQQSLAQDIAVQAAPPQLAAKATALGMVPAGTAAFLRLSDGKVLGVATAAQAAPKATMKPAAPPATSPAKKPATPPATSSTKTPAKTAAKTPTKTATKTPTKTPTTSPTRR
jgi:hypothetical protein